jgi:hypothetical protein
MLLKYGNGFASKILHSLEIWAKIEGFKYGILETGLKQPEAIALYKKKVGTILYLITDNISVLRIVFVIKRCCDSFCYYYF